MPQELEYDLVTLIKKNGQKFPGIKAAVRPKMIFIPDDRMSIEEGDRLARQMPNGLEEMFVVKERGYCPKTVLLPAHYQVKVERESGSTFPAATPGGRAYPAAGAEIPAPAKTGQVMSLTTQEMFQELRKLIIENLPQAEYSPWIIAVDEMEKAVHTPDFVKKYKDFDWMLVASAAAIFALGLLFLFSSTYFIPGCL